MTNQEKIERICARVLPVLQDRLQEGFNEYRKKGMPNGSGYKEQDPKEHLDLINTICLEEQYEHPLHIIEILTAGTMRFSLNDVKGALSELRS